MDGLHFSFVNMSGFGWVDIMRGVGLGWDPMSIEARTFL